MNKKKKGSSLEDKAASMKPNKFFKNKERNTPRSESQSVSSLYKSWLTLKNSPIKLKGNKKSSKKITPPLITKPPLPPPIPVFNGNVENISSDHITKAEGKSPLQLIDLSGSDDIQEPRSGIVSPHQVGFQVN